MTGSSIFNRGNDSSIPRGGNAISRAEGMILPLAGVESLELARRGLRIEWEIDGLLPVGRIRRVYPP